MDIKIKSKDGDIFTVNRMYLDAPYFHKLFDAMMKGEFKNEDILVFEDISSAAIRKYLEYVLTGDVEVKDMSQELLEELNVFQDIIMDNDFKFILFMNVKLRDFDFKQDPFERLGPLPKYENLTDFDKKVVEIRKKYYLGFLNEIYNGDVKSAIAMVDRRPRNHKKIVADYIDRISAHSTVKAGILKDLYLKGTSFTSSEQAMIENDVAKYVDKKYGI